MKLLTYDEALAQAQNKDWFKGFYNRDEILSDDLVKEVNELAESIGPNTLSDYFEQDKDLLLFAMYYPDLKDYLDDLKYNFVKVTK